jgi:hypothetical protein
MYMICRLVKSNGRYVIGSLSTTHADIRVAIADGRRAAQAARWRRLIPIGEIDAGNTRVLRAWETRDGGGIAVITDTTDRVPIAPPVSPSLA